MGINLRGCRVDLRFEENAPLVPGVLKNLEPVPVRVSQAADHELLRDGLLIGAFIIRRVLG